MAVPVCVRAPVFLRPHPLALIPALTMPAYTFKLLREVVIDALLRPECCACYYVDSHADVEAAEEQTFGASVKTCDAPLSPVAPAVDAFDALFGAQVAVVEATNARPALSIVTHTRASPDMLSPPPSYTSPVSPMSPTAPHNNGLALVLDAAS